MYKNYISKLTYFFLKYKFNNEERVEYNLWKDGDNLISKKIFVTKRFLNNNNAVNTNWFVIIYRQTWVINYLSKLSLNTHIFIFSQFLSIPKKYSNVYIHKDITEFINKIKENSENFENTIIYIKFYRSYMILFQRIFTKKNKNINKILNEILENLKKFKNINLIIENEKYLIQENKEILNKYFEKESKFILSSYTKF